MEKSVYKCTVVVSILALASLTLFQGQSAVASALAFMALIVTLAPKESL